MNATNKPTSNPCVQKHILKPCSLLTRWSPRVVLGTWNQPHVGYKTFNVWFQKKRFGQENGEKCGRSAPYSSRQPLWVTIIKVPLPTPPLGWARVYPYSLQPSHLLMEACVYRSVQHKPLIFPGTPKRVGVWSHLSSSFFFVCLEWMIAAEFVTYVATEDKTPPGRKCLHELYMGVPNMYIHSIKKNVKSHFSSWGWLSPSASVSSSFGDISFFLFRKTGHYCTGMHLFRRGGWFTVYCTYLPAMCGKKPINQIQRCLAVFILGNDWSIEIFTTDHAVSPPVVNQ